MLTDVLKMMLHATFSERFLMRGSVLKSDDISFKRRNYSETVQFISNKRHFNLLRDYTATASLDW